MSETLLKAHAAWQAGRVAEASALLQGAATEAPHSVKAPFLAACVALEAGDRPGAIAALDRCLALEADWPLAQLWRGQLGAEDDPQAALPHLQAAEASWPDFAPLAMHLGRAHLALQRSAEAKAAFARAAELLPEATEPWIGMALAAWQAKDLAAAVATLRHAAELQPQDPAPWFRLGWVLANAGLLEDAAFALEACLRRQADHAPAWLDLGLVRARLEDPEGAKAAFAAALEAAPGWAEAEFWLAAAQAGGPEAPAAQAAWASLAERDPANPLFQALAATGEAAP